MAAVPKASVLPEPVLALPQMSRPARAAGITSVWIGKGSMMPCSERAVQRSGDTPMVPNPASFDIVKLLVLFGPGRPLREIPRTAPGGSGDHPPTTKERLRVTPTEVERWWYPTRKLYSSRRDPGPVSRGRIDSLTYRRVGRLTTI